MSKLSPHELGAFLREQRQAAQLSLRQLSDLAGVSNPYLSQIERGLKKPSAEILQQLARGLQVSAESLYVHAGFLEAAAEPLGKSRVREAIAADTALTPRQRAVLVDVYESFVGPVGQDDGHPDDDRPAARSAAGTDRGNDQPTTTPSAAPVTPKSRVSGARTTGSRRTPRATTS
ncbi:helix-turn-helix transcriptional regulator [Lapillicoccus sp.]|uniref:helix-turn-helix domain-containing protein n=1 Tax=Lapillicoccus sp. TaxID=1909287 RepID=UPI0025E4E640|nr:helix-turn-helix transcriptional regulator [Lapillicoccus sp.]